MTNVIFTIQMIEQFNPVRMLPLKCNALLLNYNSSSEL